MDRTTEYAKIIVSGGKICGHSEYLACKRHLDNMERGNEFEYVFDVTEAERHIDIANMLTIGEGAKAQPLKTRGFQNFILGSLFGWRKKNSKARRFREAYIQMGRKNGKSFIGGEMCNDFATFDGYKYGQIYIAATKQDQANIVFKEVQKFIESDDELRKLYQIREHMHEIKSLVTESTIKAVGRDTKSLDGLKPNLAVIDELHAHPNNQMYKLMQDGQVILDSALTLAITTAGFNLNSFCYEHYKFCKKILSGAIKKETQFVYICEMDKDDDIWDQKNWLKANPLYLWNEDNTINKAGMAVMAQKAIDAKEKQGQELVNFLTKSLNQWVTSNGDSYIDAEKWAACGSDRTLEDMRGHECYLGIDLSSGGDLTSIALVFPIENDSAYIWSRSYMPELRLQEHIKTDDAPYQMWARQGLLQLTSGLYGIKTDYKRIIADLRELIASYELKVIGVGYDRHNIAGILADLEELFDGLDLTDIVQSAKALNDATIDFQLSVKAGLVEYNKHNQLLTWSMLNAVTVSNSFGEVKIDKQSAKNRIDPCDAIIDAWQLYMIAKKDKKPDGEALLEAWLNARRRSRR